MTTALEDALMGTAKAGSSFENAVVSVAAPAWPTICKALNETRPNWCKDTSQSPLVNAVRSIYHDGRCRELLAELYQVLGNLDAPAHVLDRVLAASEGRPFSNEPSLLPFVKEPPAKKLMYYTEAEVSQMVHLVWSVEKERVELVVICTTDDDLARYVSEDRKTMLGTGKPVHVEKVMCDHLYGATDHAVLMRYLRSK